MKFKTSPNCGAAQPDVPGLEPVRERELPLFNYRVDEERKAASLNQTYEQFREAGTFLGVGAAAERPLPSPEPDLQSERSTAGPRWDAFVPPVISEKTFDLAAAAIFDHSVSNQQPGSA